MKAKKATHAQVNAELNRLSGVRKISEATLEQLELDAVGDDVDDRAGVAGLVEVDAVVSGGDHDERSDALRVGERLRLLGSSHANLAPPTNAAFHGGFNNFRRSA